MTVQTTRPTDRQPDPLPSPKPYPRKQATIAAVFNGYPVAIQLADPSIEAIEDVIGWLAQREGWSAPATPATPATEPQSRPRRASAPQLPAVTRYAGDGTPLCPEHGVPMRESQFGGFFCGEKGGAHVGNNGYCRCKA